MDAAHGIADCSVVTAMARHGVTTAIRVSGLGRKWLQSPSDVPIGLCFPGHADADGNPDLGDSAMCETAGFGGFSLAASPALVQWVGGSVAESIGQSREMYEITTGNPALSAEPRRRRRVHGLGRGDPHRSIVHPRCTCIALATLTTTDFNSATIGSVSSSFVVKKLTGGRLQFSGYGRAPQ